MRSQVSSHKVPGGVEYLSDKALDREWVLAHPEVLQLVARLGQAADVVLNLLGEFYTCLILEPGDGIIHADAAEITAYELPVFRLVTTVPLSR